MGIYGKPKVCFMCSIADHHMNNCPMWKEIQPTATYLGSAGQGLGFYNVEVPEL